MPHEKPPIANNCKVFPSRRQYAPDSPGLERNIDLAEIEGPTKAGGSDTWKSLFKELDLSWENVAAEHQLTCSFSLLSATQHC